MEYIIILLGVRRYVFKISKEELALLIGNNIRKYRLKQNLTQEQLAERVGISTSFYANLERGKKSMSIKTLRDLSDALEVSVDFILYENNTRNHIRNIEVLLNNKPESFIISMEKVIRVCVAEFSDTDTKNR